MNKIIIVFSKIVILVGFITVAGCANSNTQDSENESSKANTVKKATSQAKPQQSNKADSVQNYKVTFIELGSVRCIPCQKMQPIMKSIEEKYPKQVNVVFHDVWTPKGKPYADKYGIKAIPTQVFLDENGKEFYRHEGFFPEKELENILKSNGVE